MFKLVTKFCLLILSFGTLSLFNNSVDNVDASTVINQTQFSESKQSQSIPNAPRRIWHSHIFSVDPADPPGYIQHTVHQYGHFYSGPLGRTNVTDGTSLLKYEGWLYLDDGTGPIPTMYDE